MEDGLEENIKKEKKNSRIQCLIHIQTPDSMIHVKIELETLHVPLKSEQIFCQETQNLLISDMFFSISTDCTVVCLYFII